MLWIGMGIGFAVGLIAGFFACFGLVVYLAKSQKDINRK